jgi:hypothetical protein
VLVAEVLRRAGVTLGSELAGPTVLATYILATAADGYQVVFSLAELDPATTGSEIMIADAADDQPMVMPQGPFKVVCPHDKRTSRAIRMLTKLEVVRLHK